MRSRYYEILKAILLELEFYDDDDIFYFLENSERLIKNINISHFNSLFNDNVVSGESDNVDCVGINSVDFINWCNAYSL